MINRPLCSVLEIHIFVPERTQTDLTLLCACNFPLELCNQPAAVLPRPVVIIQGKLDVF